MASDQTTDESLMARAADGSAEALNVLLRRYATPLLTFIQRMIGNRDRAEELFQEVFLAVWRQRREYQYPRPFRSWLYGIAMNKCRADFRKQALVRETVCEETSPDPASRGPSPVEAAIDVETATMVASAVALLPPVQRAVVVLRVWGGLSYREIGEALGRLEGTVRSDMFAGLAVLRRYLEPRMR